jgi:hypothetical protein
MPDSIVIGDDPRPTVRVTDDTMAPQPYTPTVDATRNPAADAAKDLSARAAKSAAKEARRQGRRFRRQLTPLTVMAGTYGAGLGIDMVGHPLIVGGAGLAASAVSWRVSGWWLNRHIERLYATAVTTAGSWWLWCATDGVGGHMPAWLAGAGGALALPWWWHYRLRGVPTDEPEQPADDAPVNDRIAEWARVVACPGGPLEKSQLLNTEEIRGGWAATIEILKGNTDRAVMATKDIGAALKLKAGSIWIEPVPEGDLHLARILVLTDNPLRTRLDWTGPTLDVTRGTSILGWYADMGEVRYRHFRPGSGPVHTLIAGSTDAGKSRTVDQLLAEERHSGVIVSQIIDPQGGQSLPDWQGNVHDYARNITEARALLTRAKDRMRARNDLLAGIRWVDELGRQRKGIGQFTPGDPRHGLKMLSITIDEAQSILKDQICRELVEDMIAMSRKCGIKFRLITQVPLLSSLGGSMAIRDAVAAGNVIVLRTANRLSGQVAFNGALPVDPSSLPKEWPDGSTTSGIGFVFAPGADRAATMRVGYVDDVFGWAISGPEVDLEPYVGPAPKGSNGATADPSPAAAPQPETPQQDRRGEDAVLAFLAARPGEQCSRGDLINRLQAASADPPALRTLVKALTDLVESGDLERVGRGTYQITERGLARQSQAVA